MSNCYNHQAVSLASKSRFARLEVTGIAGAVCRHECAIPGGFVDLYKGERYVVSLTGYMAIELRTSATSTRTLLFPVFCKA